MAAVATWSFGLESVKVASTALTSNSICVDAVEAGINSQFIIMYRLWLPFIVLVTKVSKIILILECTW